MPTTDTFIIPPMTPAEEPKKEKGEKKKSKTSKTLLLVGLILLIISLPVAIYYITKQQQDIRSRATETQCRNITPNPSGSNCFEVNCHMTSNKATCLVKKDDLGKNCCEWYTAKLPSPTYRPTNTPTTAHYTCDDEGDGKCVDKAAVCDPSPTLNNTNNNNSCASGKKCVERDAKCTTGGAVSTSTPTKKPTSKPTNEPTTKPTTKPTGEPTTEPTAEPTSEPTAEPTHEPNTSQCDASCGSDDDCVSGLTCSSVDGINRCRNASCPAESSCGCPEATSAPEDTSSDTTGQEMPVSGVGPGIIGSVTAIGSILLLIIGLAL